MQAVTSRPTGARLPRRPPSPQSLASPNAGQAGGHGELRQVAAAHSSIDAREHYHHEQLSGPSVENTQFYAMHSPKGAPGSRGAGSPLTGCGGSSVGTTTSIPPSYAAMPTVPALPDWANTQLSGESLVTWAPNQLRDKTWWSHPNGDPSEQSQIAQRSSSWESTHQFRVLMDHPPQGGMLQAPHGQSALAIADTKFPQREPQAQDQAQVLVEPEFHMGQPNNACTQIPAATPPALSW